MGSPDAFWRQTPRLLSLSIKGRIKAMEREQKGRAWLAWQLGLLPRIDPKKYPTLETLSGIKQSIDRRPQSASEIDTVMRQWRFVQAVDAGQGPKPG